MVSWWYINGVPVLVVDKWCAGGILVVLVVYLWCAGSILILYCGILLMVCLSYINGALVLVVD